jgi:hypothetical protein
MLAKRTGCTSSIGSKPILVLSINIYFRKWLWLYCKRVRFLLTVLLCYTEVPPSLSTRTRLGSSVTHPRHPRHPRLARPAAIPRHIGRFQYTKCWMGPAVMQLTNPITSKQRRRLNVESKRGYRASIISLVLAHTVQPAHIVLAVERNASVRSFWLVCLLIGTWGSKGATQM